MPTDKQIQASRTNGALSRGPVTEQGKRNSAGNSTRHGLLAQTVVLDEEDADRFQELLASFMDEYKPSTASQVSLVETMAVARWRQLRVWGVQKAGMDRDMALQDRDGEIEAIADRVKNVDITRKRGFRSEQRSHASAR